jgi:hypothetical protein
VPQPPAEGAYEYMSHAYRDVRSDCIKRFLRLASFRHSRNTQMAPNKYH